MLFSSKTIINQSSLHKCIGEFCSFELKHGHLLTNIDDQFDVNMYGWNDNTFNSSDYEIKNKSTSFGYIQDGKCKLYNQQTKCSFELCKGMYFSIPNVCKDSKYVIEPMDNSHNSGIIINQNNYNGIFNIGGPIEHIGRLRYIDGCTDSLLLHPTMYGDPCLNVLYFINNLRQTPHTHPSFRCGVVIDGYGHCKLENNITIELNKDSVFYIPRNVLHSFETDQHNKLTILAYHPDSDFGPKHHEHPMINRTIVNNVSASYIDSIHTKM
eukprot:480814_1